MNYYEKPPVLQAYCVSQGCKTKREMVNVVEIVMRNGKAAAQGNCAKCGAKVFRVGAAR